MATLNFERLQYYTTGIKNWAKNLFVQKETGKGLSSNDYTTTEKEKLSGIAEGAEANVQADWNVADTASDAFIKNKPSSLPANGGNADTVGGFTVEANVPENAKFTDTVPVAMTGATASAAGSAGYAPAPAAGTQDQFLAGDGTYKTPENTTYTAATAAKDGLMTKTDFAKLAAFGEAAEYSKTTEVENLIAEKGYQTASDVNSAITAKGYQTAQDVQAAIAAVGHIKKEIVPTKPTDTDAEENVIYMVPNGSGEDENVYDEYMKLDGSLERIGSTKVDLSNYVTKDDIISEEEIDSLFE